MARAASPKEGTKVSVFTKKPPAALSLGPGRALGGVCRQDHLCSEPCGLLGWLWRAAGAHACGKWPRYAPLLWAG